MNDQEEGLVSIVFEFADKTKREIINNTEEGRVDIQDD